MHHFGAVEDEPLQLNTLVWRVIVKNAALQRGTQYNTRGVFIHLGRIRQRQLWHAQSARTRRRQEVARGFERLLLLMLRLLRYDAAKILPRPEVSIPRQRRRRSPIPV